MGNWRFFKRHSQEHLLNLLYFIPSYVERITCNSPFVVMYSWLCRVRNLHFLIPGYVFVMSFDKSPIALSWLCIPGYVAHEISNIVFLAMSFLALSRKPIPGYVECENPYTWFLAMYSWLCRVENLISIPGYVVPDYAWLWNLKNVIPGNVVPKYVV
jgi:hypothetical protein